MKACINCGSVLEDSAKFCPNCGIAQQVPQSNPAPYSPAPTSQIPMTSGPVPAPSTMENAAPAMPPLGTPYGAVPNAEAPVSAMPPMGTSYPANPAAPGMGVPSTAAPSVGGPYSAAPGMGMPGSQIPGAGAPMAGTPAAAATPGKNNSQLFIILGVVAALIVALGIGAFVMGGHSDDSPSASGTSSDNSIDSVDGSLTIDPPETDLDGSGSSSESTGSIISGSNTYEAGMYKVGTDIPAGEYRLEQTDDALAYVCVSNDSAGDSIIDNENFANFYYITVEEGQYLTVDRAWFTPVDNYVPEQTTSVKDGMYRVGIDIPAGEYKLQATTEYEGYFALYETSHAGKEILANDLFSSDCYLTVSEGQYVYLCRCVGEAA